MYTSTIKPGLLVSLKTGIKGGADYQRREIEADHAGDNGERVARWETTRVISDPAEYERALQARGKARSAIVSVCCNSSFGLLCPAGKEAQLQTAIDVARIIADEFNATAQRTQVEVYVIAGRVAQDDVEAARAIGAEIRDLLEQMQQGIAATDPEVIREAANKARALGGMLTEQAGEKVNAAIAEARKAARDIVRRVGKAGELASKVVADLSVKSIEAARFAFLDMDAAAPVVAAPEAAAPAVDLMPLISPTGAHFSQLDSPVVQQPELEV